MVGITPSMEAHEVFYTPAYYLYRWDERVAIQRAIEGMRELTGFEVSTAENPASTDAQ